MNFNSILIGSEDPQRLVDYYTNLFGEPTMSESGYTGWMLGSGFVTVGPHEDRKSTRLNSSHQSVSRMPSSA